MTFRPNAAFLDQFEDQLGVRLAMTAVGEGIAGVARRIGQAVDPDYEVEVKQTARRVQVRAHGGGINPASWIEFGTGPPGPTPAHAPLRRGAQAMGLSLKASKV